VRLLIADYAATRIGVRAVLDDEWDVCAEADDADGAIAAASDQQPDICLIGLELPGGAVRAVREISDAAPGSALVGLATGHDADDLLAVLRAGAVGYSIAGAEPGQLRRVLRAVKAGEAAVPRSLVLELIRELQGAAGAEGLTVREAQVLGMLRRGQSTSSIAMRLGISPVTVRRHISTLVKKMGVQDRAGLAQLDQESDDSAESSARGSFAAPA
jgi:DNA-binding NarL/FixJ family response regulator